MDMMSSTVPISMMNPSDGTAKLESLARGARGLKQADEIDRVAQDFEAVFMSEMIRPMFDTVEVDSTFGGGRAEEIFKSMMINEYGKTLAANGGVGLADQVKESLIALQEGRK